MYEKLLVIVVFFMSILPLIFYANTLLIIDKVVNYIRKHSNIIISDSFTIKKKKDISDVNLPKIGIIVCTYNEEAVIEQKIKNLLAINYPKNKLKIYFVDANSTDKTKNIILKYKQKYPNNIILINQARRDGQNEAENIAMNYIETWDKDIEFIVLTDAEVIIEKNAILNAVRYLMINKDVGAITGVQITLGNGFIFIVEKLYKYFYYFLRKIESRVDSTFHVHGDLLVFRRDLWVPLNIRKGADDASIALSIRKQGYKVVHLDDVKFYEYVPLSFLERYVQKVKRGAVLIESVMLNRDIIFNKSYGLFGLLIMPFNIFLLMISPIIDVALLITLILLITYDVFINITITTFHFLLIVTFLIILFSKMIVTNSFQLIHSIIRVFLLKRNNVIWEKIRSTRRPFNFN